MEMKSLKLLAITILNNIETLALNVKADPLPETIKINIKQKKL